jgi:hypothetical protein
MGREVLDIREKDCEFNTLGMVQLSSFTAMGYLFE